MLRFCGVLPILLATAMETLAAESDFVKLLQEVRPGSTVTVPDGMHVMKGVPTLRGVVGTAENPAVLRAANRGRAVIAGDAGMVLKDCAHVVIEGLVFENDADQQCIRMENCRHVRVTRNTFRPRERRKPRHWEHWVTVEGARSSHNRIDHNLFGRKVNRGSPLFIRGDDTALVCSQHDRVDHNHFRDVVHAGRENGHETLRTGGNDLGASGRSSFTIIESNLFERCSGEDEIMSLKSSDNIVRSNTLINCRGAICLRLGSRSLVSGNVIIATEDGPGFGGVKLFGFDHQVTGNFFAGLTGTRHEAPFSFFPGLHDTETTDAIGDRYDDNTASAATRCRVSRNTWLDCSPLQIGLEKPDKEWTHLPRDCSFEDNRVLRTRPSANSLVIAGLVTALKAADNLASDPGDRPGAAWSGWFRWQHELPEDFVRPKPLEASEVGPDSP
ncbi:MAG: hypothetical protein CJBNEKGG_03422 [Prosthecobacter sp.]|nr:hypothetical protein [Prosthecobacter sp.]